MCPSLSAMTGPLQQPRSPPGSTRVRGALGIGCCVAVVLLVWLSTAQSLSLEAVVGGFVVCAIVVGEPFDTSFGQWTTAWWYRTGILGQVSSLIIVSIVGSVLVWREIISPVSLGSGLLGWLGCLIVLGFDALRR